MSAVNHKWRCKTCGTHYAGCLTDSIFPKKPRCGACQCDGKSGETVKVPLDDPHRFAAMGGES